LGSEKSRESREGKIAKKIYDREVMFGGFGLTVSGISK